MSGGHFQYKQYELGHMADEIEQIILDNDSEEVNEYGDTKGYGYSPETIEAFEYARIALLQAQIYVQRIDWLVSGDDGEDSFHRRLEVDFDALNRRLDNSGGPDVL
jgi:hypothetical protein